MVGYISSFFENVHENIDPSYQREKEEVKKNLRHAGLAATAILVASAALSIFGIAASVSGGAAAIFGLTIIFVNLPLCYLSYNVYRVSENMKDIIENPLEYQNFIGPNRRKIKTKLEEGTIFFSWVIDSMLDNMNKPSRQEKFR